MRLVAGASLLLLTVAAPAAGQDPRIEPVLVELQMARLASRTIPAHRIDDQALIPVVALFELAEIRTEPRAEGEVFAILQPGNKKVRILPARQRIEVDGRSRQLAQGEFLVQDGQLFLSTAVIAQTLGLRFEVSWTDLEVIVIDADDLPIGRRLRRAALAAARLSPRDSAPVDGRLAERRGPFEGFVTDYSVLIPTDPGPESGAYSLLTGFNLLNGAFLAGVQNQGPVDSGDVRFDVSWTGVWRDNRIVSQLRLGDGFASGPRPRALRGISFGNVPFRRPDILGQLPFTETLGPGWEIEAYRGGRLISFDSVNALGQFSLDVPIQYGENPVDFIAYGPFGEVRQFNRTYRVSADVIQAGRFEYAVSAGACRRDAPCGATGNLDLRVGLNQRVTAFAGYERFWRDTLPDLSHPYVGIVAGLTNAVVAEAEVVGSAIARGSLRIEPSYSLQVVAEATRFARDLVQPILTVPGRQQQYTLFAQVRPFGGSLRNWVVFDGSLDRFENAQNDVTSARLGGSIQTGQLRLIPSVRWARTTTGTTAVHQTTWGLNTIMLPIPQLGSFLGGITGRAGVEFETPVEARTAHAFLSRPIAKVLRLELGGTWYNGTRPNLTAFFTADLPQARAYTTVQHSPTGRTSAVQYVQGSVLYDGSSERLVLNAGPSATQSGISGRVFLDRNQNGRYDASDYVLPDVEVTVGLFSQRTDRRGEYRIWPLQSYDPVVAAVDTATLASPLWLPAYSGIELTPVPNRFSQLNIPVLSGGVVEGRVVMLSGNEEVPVPGADVILKHRATGRERRITTFRDGTFYALSIRPGEWEISVDPAVLTRLGRQAEPLGFTVPQLVEGATVSGLVLRVR